VSSLSSPAVGRVRQGFAVAGVGALFVVGLLIDICGLINVPGAVRLPAEEDGNPATTNVGLTVILLIVAAWGTVFWLNRSPAVAFVAGGLLALVGVSYALMLVGAVAYVLRHRERLARIALIVVVVVGLYVGREVVTPWGAALPWFLTARAEATTQPLWGLLSLIIAVISLGAAAAVVLTSRARQLAEQSDEWAKHERQRAETLAEQMVRQAERERIARDMHDALAHRLSVVSLHAGALEANALADETMGTIARTVREQTHAALQDMRGLIGELRSEPVDSSPLTIPAVGALLKNLRAGGVPITAYVVLVAPERVSAQLDSAVYRIVQEALTNAVKHSPAEAIDVFVQANPADGVRIRVTNPIPVSSESTVPGGGNGILGIRERADALNGSSWIGAYDSKFIVDVTLPWQDGEPLAR